MRAEPSSHSLGFSEKQNGLHGQPLSTQEEGQSRGLPAFHLLSKPTGALSNGTSTAAAGESAELTVLAPDWERGQEEKHPLSFSQAQGEAQTREEHQVTDS